MTGLNGLEGKGIGGARQLETRVVLSAEGVQALLTRTEGRWAEVRALQVEEATWRRIRSYINTAVCCLS